RLVPLQRPRLRGEGEGRLARETQWNHDQGGRDEPECDEHAERPEHHAGDSVDLDHQNTSTARPLRRAERTMSPTIARRRNVATSRITPSAPPLPHSSRLLTCA